MGGGGSDPNKLDIYCKYKAVNFEESCGKFCFLLYACFEMKYGSKF